jgi:hypothetical protein
MAWTLRRQLAFHRRRICKTYRREAEVIHPLVDIERFALRRDKEDFYLSARHCRKRVPLIERFAAIERRLVGRDGPEAPACSARCSHVALARPPEHRALIDWMQRAGVRFAAEEDFGIAPVEAQACARRRSPMDAAGRWTVRGGAAPTGLSSRTICRG